MSSTTTMVATDFRIREWANQVHECQSRPSDMKVTEWCAAHGITKSNYYYRLRKVREACLTSVSTDGIRTVTSNVVPVPAFVMRPVEAESQVMPSAGLDIITGTFQIRVSQQTSMDLLAAVLRVVADVK